MLNHTSTGLIMLVFVILAAPATGQISNGGFDTDLANWVTYGTVEHHSDPGFAILGESEEGSLSYISQTFTLPANTAAVRLRYGFFQSQSSRTGIVSPDALLVYVNYVNGSPAVATPSDWQAPTAFYVDSDGHQRFDATGITQTATSEAGIFWLRMDIANPPATDVDATLEIGLAAAANGVTSFAIIDDVHLIGESSNCPPDWCCDSNDMPVERLSDNNLCTSDQCESATGIALHTQIDPDDDDECTEDSCDPLTGVSNVPIPGCTNYEGTDIIFMLDASGRITNDDWLRMKFWVRNTILHYSGLCGASGVGTIRVAIGRFCDDWSFCTDFGGPFYGGAAGIDLTQPSINLLGVTSHDCVFFDDPLNDSIGKSSSALSNLQKGIIRAVDHFNNASDPSSRKVLILMTDGWMRKPNTGICLGTVEELDNDCQSGLARCFAEEEDRTGIEVFVARFVSGYDYAAAGCCDNYAPANECTDEYAEIRVWLRDSIASGLDLQDREAHMIDIDLSDVNVTEPYACVGCAIPLECTTSAECASGATCIVDPQAGGFCVLDDTGP